MADTIRRGTCGACKNFDFEGNQKKGYCSRYRDYYWDDDGCSNYDENKDRLSSRDYNVVDEDGKSISGGSGSSSSGGCFLTTACCQYKGLPDDCYELTTLRNFRDTYLKTTEAGNALVEEYYRIAPSIVDKIMENPNKAALLEDIYTQVCKILVLIQAKRQESAINAYQTMVLDIQSRIA